MQHFSNKRRIHVNEWRNSAVEWRVLMITKSSDFGSNGQNWTNEYRLYKDNQHNLSRNFSIRNKKPHRLGKALLEKMREVTKSKLNFSVCKAISVNTQANHAIHLPRLCSKESQYRSRRPSVRCSYYAYRGSLL